MSQYSKAKIAFGKTPLFKVSKRGRLEALEIASCFGRVIDKFIEDPGDNYSLLETVSLSCTLVEATIKEKLRKINPVLTLHSYDPVSVAVASRKQQKLLETTKVTLANLPSAPITQLMDRFAFFYKCSEAKEIRKLISIRNQMVHSAAEAEVSKRDVTLILAKYVFVFLERYIPISRSVWDEVVRMGEVAHSELASSVMRDLVKARRRASHLTPEDVRKAIEKSAASSYEEDVVARLLTCPACSNESVTFYVTEDVTPEDYSVKRYAVCSVCDLWLDETDVTEVTDSAEKYFLKTDKIADWRYALGDSETFYMEKYGGYEPDEDYYRGR